MRCVFYIGLLLLASCATPEPLPPVRDASYDAWLVSFKQKAREAGISEQTLEEAFAAVSTPDETVLRLDRKQPESTMTLEQYMQKVITPSRIENGRALLTEHQAVLTQVSETYAVPPEYIVALWGIETSYGNNTGGFSIIDALATLAYDGRRSEYFGGELMNALRIIDADHIEAYDMQGSWAGAMGQCQFMPSSFLAYAVDYDGDGRRDIWNTQADVFASIANYLSRSGWNGDRENNFNVLLKWNRSRYFATAVMKIAEGIKE